MTTSRRSEGTGIRPHRLPRDDRLHFPQSIRLSEAGVGTVCTHILPLADTNRARDPAAFLKAFLEYNETHTIPGAEVNAPAYSFLGGLTPTAHMSHCSLTSQQSLQILTGQQGRILWPLQEGADIVADGLQIQRG